MSVIRWFSISEASQITGLDEEFLRQAIEQKLLLTAKTGRLQTKNIISDVELNRFSMNLQYGEKHKIAKQQISKRNTDNNNFAKQVDNIMANLGVANV